MEPPRFGGPPSYAVNSDAAALGLDRNTVEGAQVDFFSRLGGKPAHKVIAWIALLVMFVLPLLLMLFT